MASDSVEQTGFPVIEILDGDHFIASSIAQFSFRVLAAESVGDGLVIQGEVFDDAVSIHFRDLEIAREDGKDLGEDSLFVDDETARRIVTANLFGDHPTLF